MSQGEEKSTVEEAGAPDTNRRNFLRSLVGGAGLAALAAIPAECWRTKRRSKYRAGHGKAGPAQSRGAGPFCPGAGSPGLKSP
jgi:hypothetical protein